jgi:hypothetical protein
MEEEEEYDKFGPELEKVQAAMKRTAFPIGQVSGWDDDAEGVEEERNPFGKFVVLRTVSNWVLFCGRVWLYSAS